MSLGVSTLPSQVLEPLGEFRHSPHGSAISPRSGVSA